MPVALNVLELAAPGLYAGGATAAAEVPASEELGSMPVREGAFAASPPGTGPVLEPYEEVEF